MIIGTRSLKLRQGQNDASVAVRVFMPERGANSWTTRYEIDWPEATRKGVAHGLNSVQALMLALKMVGSEIYTSNYHKSKKLMWERPGQGYGFPVSQNIRDLLEGDDAKYF